MTLRLVSAAGDERFELVPGRPLVIGRALDSDLPVYDPTISRRHAELVVQGDAVQVRDLGSSNGTCINGTRVPAGRLTVGDTVTFGKVHFQLERVAVAPGPGTVAGGTIVRQLEVSGGGRSALGLGRVPKPADSGQLRVAEEDADQRLARKLALLLDVAQKLAGQLDLDRLLGTVADTTFEVMNVDRVVILLRDDSGALLPAVSRSHAGEVEAQTVPRSIAEKVVRERVAVLSQNAAADARFKGQSIMVQSVRSAICSPLMAENDEVLGVLYVDNLTAANSFSDEDLQFLVAFSGLAAIAIRTSRYAAQVRREAVVRSNFERYFAPNVAAEIAQQSGGVALGGEKRAITILFSDIRGFTTLSESMSPDLIAALLSDYFTVMVDVIFEHGGTLDKFIGDAIMALWGAPIAHADDADRAVRAAVAMQEALAALNARWRAAGRPTIEVGIGLNHGEVFAGNIGSHRRLEYTVIGDAVNVAARLCAEAGAGQILVSDALMAELRHPVDTVERPDVVLRGKTRSVGVFEVRRASDDRTRTFAVDETWPA